MAVYLVKNYVLRYDMDKKAPWVIFHYQKDGSWRNENWYPPKEDAVFLSDMLRNEKPIYFIDTGTRKWLTTSSEVIGEEET